METFQFEMMPYMVQYFRVGCFVLSNMEHVSTPFDQDFHPVKFIPSAPATAAPAPLATPAPVPAPKTVVIEVPASAERQETPGQSLLAEFFFEAQECDSCWEKMCQSKMDF